MIPALSPGQDKTAFSKTVTGRTYGRKSESLGMGMRRVFRAASMVFGALIILLGFAIAPLPGPLGLPVAVVGLMIVLRNSMWAKREFVRLKRRHPNWLMPLRKLMRKRPQFASVFWQQMLRTERLLLRRRRRMAVWRRRMFRKRK